MRQHSQGEGPSPWGICPVYTAFLCADYDAPSDSPLWPRAFVRRFPLTPSPLLLASTGESPVFGLEDAHGMMEVACSWLPRPLFAASQSTDRVRQVSLHGRGHAGHGSGPSSGLASPIAGVTGWHQRHGMPGPRFPVGLGTLQGMPRVIPQPSTTSWGLGSPAWRLAGACCSRHRVVYDASLQGLIGSLYTQRCFHILPHRFHGAQRGSWVGTRRVATCTFPHPPRLEPCVRLSPHTAQHLRSFSVVILPHEAFLPISAAPRYAFPVYSLRVRCIPLVRSSRGLGAFAMGSVPRVSGFPAP